MPIIIVEGKSAERKKAKGRCLIQGCTTIARKSRDYCSKHEHEVRKEKDPYLYWYGILRRNAKRRGKVFTISLEYFTSFCKETSYITLKGRKSKSMTIDRIIDELGYIEGNIQILEKGENTRKRFVDYWKHHDDDVSVKEIPIDISDIVPEKPPASDGIVPF